MRGPLSQRYERLLGMSTGVGNDIVLAMARGPRGVARLVVLKGLAAGGAGNPEAAIERLSFEARLTARMRHPNVITAHALCFDGRRPVLALEYLEGQSLATLLDAANASPAFTLELRIGIVCRILRGLHHVHELRDFDGRRLWAIHAAVCPSHVMITYDGQVKLIDFSHAVTRRAAAPQAFVGGNFPYMAPEQVRGAPDCRVDVFSVGVLLWEMLAQTLLWGQTPAEVIFRRLLTGVVPRLKEVQPDCDVELDRICARAMATHPGDRYATALEMCEALERYLASRSLSVSDAAIGALLADVCREQRQQTERTLQARLAELRLPAREVGPHREPTAGEARASHGRSWTSPSTILGGGALVVAALLLGRILGQGYAAPAEPAALHTTRPALRPGEAAASVTMQRAERPPNDLVTLEIGVSPAHATLYLDGQRLSSNPTVASMVRDGRLHSIRGEADGFQPFTQTFDLALDLFIAAGLEPVRPASKRTASRTDRRLAEGRARPRSARFVPRAVVP